MTPFLKDGTPRVRTVFSKDLFELKYELDIVFLIKKMAIFKCGFSTNVTSTFLIQETYLNYQNSTLLHLEIR